MAASIFHRRNFNLGAVADNRGLRRSEIHQRLDGGRRTGTGAHFQPVAKQDENEQDGRGFEELPPPSLNKKVLPTLKRYPVPTLNTTSTAMLSVPVLSARQAETKNVQLG